MKKIILVIVLTLMIVMISGCISDYDDPAMATSASYQQYHDLYKGQFYVKVNYPKGPMNFEMRCFDDYDKKFYLNITPLSYLDNVKKVYNKDNFIYIIEEMYYEQPGYLEKDPSIINYFNNISNTTFYCDINLIPYSLGLTYTIYNQGSEKTKRLYNTRKNRLECENLNHHNNQDSMINLMCDFTDYDGARYNKNEMYEWYYDNFNKIMAEEILNEEKIYD